MKLKVYGIIPAAGRSRRMGAPKQLLPVDGRPMLLAAVDSLLAGDLAGIIVVTHAGIAGALPEVPRVQVLLNNDPETCMIDSIRLAVRHGAALGADGFLLCPSDLPGLDAATVNACLHSFRRAPEKIHVAVHESRRGHPLVFGRTYLQEVQSDTCNGGLRDLLRVHPEAVIEVPTENPAIHRNVNTPEDYRALG
jgi:molybdenum cofactor cytidylyltransferase